MGSNPILSILTQYAHKTANVTELVYVLDLKSNEIFLKGSSPFIRMLYVKVAQW